MNMHIYPLFASPLVTMRVKENIDELSEYVKKEPFGVGKQTGNKGSQSSKDRRVLEKYSDIRDIIMQYFCISSHEILRYDGSFKMNMDYFDYCAGLRMTNNNFHELFKSELSDNGTKYSCSNWLSRIA